MVDLILTSVPFDSVKDFWRNRLSNQKNFFRNGILFSKTKCNEWENCFNISQGNFSSLLSVDLNSVPLTLKNYFFSFHSDINANLLLSFLCSINNMNFLLLILFIYEHPLRFTFSTTLIIIILRHLKWSVSFVIRNVIHLENYLIKL